MRKLLLVILALILLAAIAAGGFYFWLRGGKPVRHGEHRVAGLTHPVEVRWDRWGVPALLAQNEADLAAALGFIHANDRFTQMELGRRAAAGRLAEILGEPAYELDVYFRTLRFPRTAEKMWNDTRGPARQWLEAYAIGVNAWLERDRLPPELRLLGVLPEPWRPVDSLGFALLMARDLSFWDDRPEEKRQAWLEAHGADTLSELLGVEELHVPDMAGLERPGRESTAAASSAVRRRVAESGPRAAGAALGSNNWAIGPARTRMGAAIVANDPHLGLRLPGTWYQVHLRAPGFEAAGMTLPGAPAVVIGRGTHIAWAMTNTMLDDHDLFYEILDEEGRVRRGEEWVEVATEETTILLRGGEERILTLRETDRGPLLDADPELGLPSRSLAWTAHAGGDPLSALHRLARATGPQEAIDAMRSFVCPAQNLVAAFADGRLLLQVIGRVPDRRRGDGRLPAPGWDPSYGWDSLRSMEINPTVVDPENQLIVTANEDIRPPGFTATMTADFFPGHRARRIRAMIEERDGWDWERVGKLQTDLVSPYAGDLVRALAGESFEGAAGEAFLALAGWDYSMARRGPAALFALFERELRDRVFADEATAGSLSRIDDRAALWRLMRGEMAQHFFDDVTTEAVETRRDVIAAALAAAWEEGGERWGKNVARWDYGEIHRLHLGHPLSAVPLLGRFLDRGPFEVPGSPSTVAAFISTWNEEKSHMRVLYGPSMRFVVDWSQSDTALVVNMGGQSGHPADPHYDDQIEPFLSGRLHLAPWSEEKIAAQMVTSMRLTP